MAKSQLEKALEKKQKEEARNLKKQMDQNNKLAREEALRLRAASIVNGQPIIGNMRIADKTSETMIECICKGYDIEQKYNLRNNCISIPEYISDIKLEFEKLKQYGFLSNYAVWIDSCWEIDILPNLLSYFEDKEKALEADKESKLKQISIGTINASNANIIFGDVSNSSLVVDNSISNLKEKIENEGGDDKEELLSLLEEFKEILENIEESRHIPKNKGFTNRLSGHLDKHGWFYAEIVNLLGMVGLKLFMN